MSDKPEKPTWTGKAAIAGAAIGSAAIAAALLYASRRKDRAGAGKTVLIPPPAPEAPSGADEAEAVTRKPETD